MPNQAYLGLSALPLEPVVWMGDSLLRLREFPKPVREELGFALFQAQLGKTHIRVKPLKGLGSGVLQAVSDYRGDTFRAIFTVRLPGKVYVLHVFQKKSRKGISTPKSAIELMRQRLKLATQLHESRER